MITEIVKWYKNGELRSKQTRDKERKESEEKMDK